MGSPAAAAPAMLARIEPKIARTLPGKTEGGAWWKMAKTTCAAAEYGEGEGLEGTSDYWGQAAD